VNTDGTVGDVRVIRGLDAELDAIALEATRQWRFESGTSNGQPVPVVVSIELTFKVRD
jgi:TonB family protein